MGSVKMMWSYFLLLTISCVPLFGYVVKECNDGILHIGGETQYSNGISQGYSLKVTLLKESGWCEQSGFPDLPGPLKNAAAYFLNSYLHVCGFDGDSSCKYTARGWDSWYNLPAVEGDTHFQMTYSTKVGSIVMTSGTLKWNSHDSNHLQHNPSQIYNPDKPLSQIPWIGLTGSPFNLSSTDDQADEYLRDISLSCLASMDGDLLLSGGFETERPGNGESKSYVAKWSPGGSSFGTRPPKFEDGVIPNMNEARESHSCTEFDGGVIASGGYSRTTVNLADMKASAEFFDGTRWIPMRDMTTPRFSFQLQQMCGAAVAIGGAYMIPRGHRGWELVPLSTVEQIWSVYGEWIPAPYYDLSEPTVGAASSPVSDMDCWTG